MNVDLSNITKDIDYSQSNTYLKKIKNARH